ncbi:tetratricopeptide repeat protein [Streptomyces sp. NBC_01465]|uniref:tetratricopeptide repeat protein n=1 Tax=Streptomyces sp. NBC_01465 TaxID=2903878 RepID=UPI002E37C30D|nr:tetratricopeptide repeat protein [Streptomyces sp. NBC_01465]
MSTPTPTEIRQAVWENENAPNGLLRNARAEELVAAAEQAGDRGVLRTALFGLIKAYEYSTERGKMLVPFARLMKEWDQDPSAFDSMDTYYFHWMFKWVTSGMLSLPEVPLAAMEGWLVEMERRYRLAGFTERAVRQAEFDLADETGDRERADRAFAAWTAAERDRMANCHACELNDQGHHWYERGDDAKALEVWEPVLAGRLSCQEEPHRTLAKSLLPLVRTGRADEARAHHLRGYRMARGNESLLPTVGLHIEFCALTGNEGRGLEILTDHASHLAANGNPAAQLSLFTGVLVLLGRLVALGQGDRPVVAYEGQLRTAAELHGLLQPEADRMARSFDERNGSTVVSGRLAARVGRVPLLDALPLGLRPSAVPVAPVQPSPAPAPTDDVAELAVEARRLRSLGHPGTRAVWDRIEALTRDGGQSVDSLLAAELLEHTAIRTPSRAGFEAAVAAYRAADEPSRAAIAEVWVTVAAAQEGADPEEIRTLLATAAASAEALDAADSTRVRRIAAVDLTRIRLDGLLSGAAESEAGPAVEEFVVRYEAVPEDVSDLLADAETMLAQRAWAAQDWPLAEALLTSAAERGPGAGRPWDAVEVLGRRASLQLMLGRAEDAEESARAALEHSAEITDPAELGAVRLTLAEVLYRQDGKEAEAAEHALDAAHWFDAAGDTAGAGAMARLVLAQAYGETGRAAEAAEVLESALPDLLEHGEEETVRARETLGNQLRALGDQRAAAEQYLLATETAKGWENPFPQARLATMAAECLTGAGLSDEAEQAYARAIELWSGTGEPVQLARALRSLAWLKVRDEDPGDAAVAEARGLMVRALDAVAGDGPELVVEQARTWSQLAELITDELYGEDDDESEDDGADDSSAAVRREAVLLWQQAADAFAALGPDFLRDRAQCVTRLAWTERELDRGEEGARRLRELVEELKAPGAEAEVPRELLKQLEQQLKHLS